MLIYYKLKHMRRLLTRKLLYVRQKITQLTGLEKNNANLTDTEKKLLKAMWAEHFYTEILNPKHNDEILVDNLISETTKLPDRAITHFIESRTSEEDQKKIRD